MSDAPHARPDRRTAIAALEAQRHLLGDEAVDAALAVLLRAPADARADARQELKQLTILFADIVGSTSISQALDPEEIHEAIDGVLARLAECVRHHGGHVLKYMGDGMMAAFGIAGVREDDAVRAVRCGLALAGEARAGAARFPAPHPIRALQLRVGIHTGRVLVGGGVDAAANIRGMAVNIAARMEQTAPPGRVRISQDTYEHVRRVFEVEPQAELRVKGCAEPVRTVLVVRPAARGGAGETAPFVGRVRELDDLERAWRVVEGAAAPVFRSVLVIGEPGMGKSRLLREFTRRVAARAGLCVDAASLPLRARDPYGLLRNLLRASLGLAPQADRRTEAESLRRAVAAASGGDPIASEENANALAALLGLDAGQEGGAPDPQHLRHTAFHAASAVLGAATTGIAGPTLVLLDDLQECDAGSLDFLDQHRKRRPGARTLLLGFGRPAVLGDHAEWVAGMGADTIRLDPLSRGETEALVRTLLGDRLAADPGLCALVEERCAGNPFFVEELVNMLQGGAGGVRVPQTLVGVVEARLDRMTAAEKRAIQQASVVGPCFEPDVLRAIDAAAPESLGSLVRHDFIVPASGARGEAFAFRHQILQEVAYQTILKQDRRTWHERLANWMAADHLLEDSDRLARIAHHYDQAGCDDLACEYHSRAAEHAAGVFAHDAALAHASRALELARRSDLEGLAMRWRLLDVRERTLDLLARRTQQMEDATAMAGIAERLDDALRLATATLRQARIVRRLRDFEAQARFARQAVAHAQRAGNLELKLDAQRILAEALSDLGDPAGEALAMEGIEAARSAGLRMLEGSFMNVLSVNAFLRDDLARSLELDRRELAIYREIGHRRLEASTLANVGCTLLAVGALAEAGEALHEALRLARGMGDRHAEAYMLQHLSRLAFCMGDMEAARDWAQRAVHVAVEVEDPEFHAVALCRLGDARLALGDTADALACFERAKGISAAHAHGVQWDACSGQARCALRSGQLEIALEALAPLLRHLESGGSMEGVTLWRLALLTCHDVLQAAGDPRAKALLRRARDGLVERAQTLGDPAMSASFMTAIPEHRAILEACACGSA